MRILIYEITYQADSIAVSGITAVGTVRGIWIIPFEVNADPFYSESNMKYLEKVISDIDSGRAKLVEHDLIEVE